MSLRNLIHQPVSKDDVAKATRVIVRSGNVSPIVLSRTIKMPYSKAVRIIAMLEGANIVSPEREGAGRIVIIKNETAAVNAALRRFNKGKRSR
jgi:predicted transcriptional regulator